MADLAATRHARHVDVVPAFSHLVGRLRQRQDRHRDPSREIERESPDDDERDEEREREPRQQGHPGVAELSLRLGDDQVAEDGAALLAET